MRQLFTIILFLAISNLNAQPGPFGGYDMSFTLMDKMTNTIINSKNKNYKVFPTHYYRDSHEIIDTFKYDLKTNRFYYTFGSTPVGPAILAQFTINVISGIDTMKIYSASSFIADTLHFQKGEFIVSEQFLISKSIGTYNSAKIINNSIYDYELSKLTKLPYCNIEESGQLKLGELHHSIFKSHQLPNKDLVLYGIVNERAIEGNVLFNGVSGSYSAYNNKTTINDKGIAFYILSNPDKLIIDYNYEKLDLLLGKIDNNFSLHDSIFKNYFSNGLNWKDTNSITFAILANLQIINDKLWTITLNQNKLKKQIYISNDRGINWEKVFSINSDLMLNLRYFNRRKIFAFSGNKLYYSKNYGKSWSGNILKKNSMNIVDLVIANNTTGFLLNQNNSSELIKFNPRTGEYIKLFDNIGCCYFERALSQRVNGLYYYDNTIVIKTGVSFLLSRDNGLTWSIVNNDCIRILKNSTFRIWYKGSESKEEKMNFGYYYPKYYRCDKFYNIILVLINNNKIKALYRYRQEGHSNSPCFLGDLEFKGLDEIQIK
jgi:hypothetical protein